MMRLFANIVHSQDCFLSDWICSRPAIGAMIFQLDRQATMGKVARNVVLSLTISVSVAAAAAEPAAAKRALHHYASTCHSKDAYSSRRAWCRHQRSSGAKEAEADALLQCLLSQPFATCD
jgi:hypothetical protein